MRSGALCLLVGACGFETQVPPSSDLSNPDASTKLPDAAHDAAAISIDAPPPKVCAAAYVAVPPTQTQSKYRRIQVQTAWLTAKADCESDGGHMIIAETATEAIAIHAFVDPLDSSPYCWVGILDPERDGQWKTVTNKPFTVPSWGANNPQQRAGEIYALVYSDGKYFDWFDDGAQEYACECEP
ncbi:MAG: C-type lectin domain-containing protein [Deltaproteobacteria bacterium]|nr:C-type lectin domain-containing protein [Deltaproteobacteria bacterium]